MLSRRCATAVINANWWDSGRLEHLVRPMGPPVETHPAARRQRNQARPDGSAQLTRPHTERGCVLPTPRFQQPRDQCANPMGMKATGCENKPAAHIPRAGLNVSATQRCDQHANAATNDQALLKTTRTILEARTTSRRPTPRETVEHQANQHPLPARGRGQP